MNNDQTIEDLIAVYIQNVHIHREASLEDPNRANEAYRRLNDAFLSLKKKGLQGTSKFLELLKSEDEDVRGWVASHALDIDEKKAILVLKELQKKGGLTGMEAEFTLINWEKMKNNPSRNKEAF